MIIINFLVLSNGENKNKNMEENVCPICNKKSKSINSHLTKKTDDKHKNFIIKLKEDIKYYLNKNYYVFEINEIIKKKYLINFDVKSIISKYSKEIGINGYNIISIRRKGGGNPVFTNGTIDKIKNSVKALWDNGVYDNRVNGMTGKTGKDDPKFNLITYLKRRYKNLCYAYHGKKCINNNCKFDQSKIDVHHIDEDHSNFLLSNLEPFCIRHHMNYHYESSKKPFIEITREFRFESAHNILNYSGNCKNLHGHSYILHVSIRKRINSETGMVMDFSILDKIVNEHVVENLDHKYINEVMKENPTAENMLIWIWEKLEKEALLKGLTKIKLWETEKSSAEITKYDVLKSEEYLKTYYYDIEKYLKKQEDKK